MPQATADALDEIAAELYALTPAEFTAARNSRAALADPALAKRLKALRKPVIAAWTVDLLAREGQLGDALDLAAALREAQDDLDAAELARLGRQRRQLVAALAAQAVELAADRGVTVSAAAVDDVRKTINAAVMDAAAAAAVMTARLVAPLEAGSVDDDTLAAAVGGSVPGVVVAAPADDLAERRARKAAEKAAREADRAANEAEREHGRIATRRDTARERVDHLRERIDDMRRDLARLESDEAEAARRLAELDAQERAAASRAKDARGRAQAAMRTLE
ncbi:hypothetical protein GCM10022200_16480 [Microbacterium awajiense]|uniref:Transposase n=1 Tax=Microbacterium awajiense TaxID=415214 RepID=A0ABP7AJE8_9MICO